MNRPSRFDVKYRFDLPTEELRRVYIAKWIEKIRAPATPSAQDAKGIRIAFENEEKVALDVAKRTDGWSFAFLKEL